MSVFSKEQEDNFEDETINITGRFASATIDKARGSFDNNIDKIDIQKKTLKDDQKCVVLRPISQVSNDNSSIHEFSRSFTSVSSTVTSDNNTNLSETPNKSTFKRIRRVRFIRPQTIIEYDSEEGTAVEFTIPDIMDEKNTIFSKFLGTGWSTKKPLELSENVKINKKLISIYKKSCNDFEDIPNPAVLEAIKSASKLDHPFNSLKLSGVKNLTKNSNAFADLIQISHELKTLELVDCQLNDSFVKTISISLTSLQKLETINIAENAEIQVDGLNHLLLAASELKSLKTLNISGIKITLEIAKKVADFLSLMHLKDSEYGVDRLLNLYMDNCSFSLQSLEITLNAAKSQKVKRLFIRKNKLNKHHSLSLKRLLIDVKRKSLVNIFVNDEINQPIVYSTPTANGESVYEIEQQPFSGNLKLVDLSNNPLGDVVAELSKYFVFIKEIRSLVLRKCNMTYTSFASLSKGIQENSCINFLDISRNVIFSKFNEKEIRVITDLIDNSTALEALVIEDCGITENVALHIAKHLENAPSLKSVNLNNNSCATKKSLNAFITAATRNQRIVSVKMTVHVGNEEQRKLEKILASQCAKNQSLSNTQI
ncbi:hypothetical protein BB561_003290 [Smittium simulii]|uniref:Uncharacterized protein n=1 Tax=Smittium simulii TaxID=133385 RepID=A0A2T9YM48_9FUNG|nr:hypothetical protein BB561_003290 [Smittium simulii]